MRQEVQPAAVGRWRLVPLGSTYVAEGKVKHGLVQEDEGLFQQIEHAFVGLRAIEMKNGEIERESVAVGSVARTGVWQWPHLVGAPDGLAVVGARRRRGAHGLGKNTGAGERRQGGSFDGQQGAGWCLTLRPVMASSRRMKVLWNFSVTVISSPSTLLDSMSGRGGAGVVGMKAAWLVAVAVASGTARAQHPHSTRTAPAQHPHSQSPVAFSFRTFQKVELVLVGLGGCELDLHLRLVLDIGQLHDNVLVARRRLPQRRLEAQHNVDKVLTALQLEDAHNVVVRQLVVVRLAVKVEDFVVELEGGDGKCVKMHCRKRRW